MPPSADLFVVCKHCGSEVSPYVTECPYCGQRLRRRAPKLPREKDTSRAPHGLLRGLPARQGRRATAGTRSRRSISGFSTGGGPATRPYATLALVAASCVLWVLLQGEFIALDRVAIKGPLSGDWWKLFSTQFAYVNGLYGFFTVLAIAIFGWLLERRRGPLIVLALFFGAGASGALVACAINADPLVIGGNAAALGLLAAWAVPDLQAAARGDYYEGDLLGAGAFAALLLAIPLARAEASWVAGLTGAAFGLLIGFGLHQIDRPEP
jgi:membrane associated rhomboid family serine protease